LSYAANPPTTILDAMPKRERDVVLSFITLSSRKTASADEVIESICLSLSLKVATRNVPN
jgi:hypothetical protein